MANDRQKKNKREIIFFFRNNSIARQQDLFHFLDALKHLDSRFYSVQMYFSLLIIQV